MKKIFKGVAIFVGVVLLILLILPFAFKGKIIKIAKEQANANVNAVIDFQDLSISMFRSFPDVSVDIKKLSVVNKAPFLGDTLASIGHTYVDVSLMSLLDIPKINKVKIADVYVNVKVNKDSVTNYDIALPSEAKVEETTTKESSPIALDIHNYSLENININYQDVPSNMSAKVVNFNHSGSGNLADNILELDTHTNADAISFMLDDVAYLKDLHFEYDAKVGVDHGGDLKLTFTDNVAYINDLNLAFDGVFTMLKDAYDINFTLKSKKSEFKSLLSLIPNAYTADFPKVTTAGALDLHGVIKGQYSDNTIPTMDIVIKSENASVQYPDLPNKIDNINIDTHITNTTGIMDDLQVEIKNFGFKIAQDVFSANAIITKPISNLTLASKIDGKVNLGNLKNAYPIPPLDFDLKGIVEAHIAANFDMAAIDKEQYQNIDSSGSITLNGVSVGSDYTPNPLVINKAKMLFSLNHVDLKETELRSGNSDVRLKGGLDNIYGYAFADGTLKGKLEIASKLFRVSDFYEADTATVAQKEEVTNTDTTQPSEQFKVPSNIEFVGTVDAKEILYDDITLTNFRGKTIVKNQKITFNDASANLFKGTAIINGFVDTKPTPTAYDFDMKLKQINIASAFSSLEMLRKVAPVVGAFNGRFDTDLNLSGILDSSLMPDLSKLSGGAFANLQVDKIDPSQNKFLSLAESKLGFLDFDKTDLKDLKTKITFKDSKVNVQPFTLKYKDIPVVVGGSHSFDNQMDYSLKLDLPAKYLGNQARELVRKLSGADQENLRVPLVVNVGGTVTNPTVQPEMKDAVASLTKSIVDNQKEKAKEKVKSEVSKKLNDILGTDKSSEGGSEKESKSAKDQAKDTGKKLLKGLFGK
ncbi:hypothetical protein ACXGQW_06860 [Wenyingzhuangia sp. IMCC45533]